MAFSRFHRRQAPVDPHSSWFLAGMVSLAAHGVVLTVVGALDWPEIHRPRDEITATEEVEYFNVFIPATRLPSVGPPSTESGPAEPTGRVADPLFESPAAKFSESPPTTASLQGPASAADSNPLSNDLAAISSASSGYSEASNPRVLFPARDPRLHVGGPLPLLPQASPDEADERLRAAMDAVPDSMAAQSRREASMGFSRLNGQLTRGRKLIMPTDGRLWETAQMLTYGEVAVRDSIRAERVRIMRERADEARAERRSQP